MRARGATATIRDRGAIVMMISAAVAAAAVTVFALGTRAARATAPAARIVVLAEATVEGEVVRLADVARLEGHAAAILADLEIGRAPAPGAVRAFPGAGVLDTLRRADVDLDRVRYRIPAVVRVRRRAQEVSAAAVRAIVESHLRQQGAAAEGEVLVRQVDVTAPVRLPVGPYTSQVTALHGSPAAGTARLLVEFLQDGRVAGSVTATAHVAVFGDVWVSRRAIPRGTTVAADDVTVERRDVSVLPRDAVTRVEEVVRKEARVAIPALMPLRHDQLRAPAVVRRGDIVTLLAESAGLRITTKGEVREDAPRDAQVRVWNLASRKEVVGRVVDEQTIAVAF
jgi:flagella basal body P-ring formation protein FlgA